MNNTQDAIGDQTRFYSQEPIQEHVAFPDDPHPEPKKPILSPRRKKILIGVGIALAVVVGSIIFALILMRAKPAAEAPDSGVIPVVTDPNLSPLQTRVVELRSELEAADPSTDELPLPPLNLNLRLEAKQKR
jgi:hypothetical protein